MTDSAPMQSKTSADSPIKDTDTKYEINLIGHIELLLNYKKLIMALVLAAFVASAIVSMILPVRYTATARILPPKESAGAMNPLLTKAEGMLGGLAGDLMGQKAPSELYVGILKSRTVADDLIQKFELRKRYNLAYIEDIYAKLAGRSRILADKNSRIIVVAVEDENPERAAQMANAYVDALDRINRKINITEGQKKRVFLEERLSRIRADLTRAETGLKEFQERHKLVSLEEQAKATIDVAAEIKGEIIAAQTKLEIQRQFGTQRQSEAVMLMAEIEELQRQLAAIQSGGPESDSQDRNIQRTDSDLFIPIATMPDLGLKLARLTRKAKIQEKIFELMTTQLELAKMEEAKDVNIIQVLDRAVPPEKKSYPNRRAMVLLSTLSALFGALVLAFFFDYISRLRRNNPEQYDSIKTNLRLKKVLHAKSD